MEKDLKILRLTDFIAYDVVNERFVVRPHTIEVPEKTFSFNDIRNSTSADKKKLRWVMKDLCENKEYSFKRDIWKGKVRGSNLKVRIERFLAKNLGIYDSFDFISVEDEKLELKQNTSEM